MPNTFLLKGKVFGIIFLLVMLKEDCWFPLQFARFPCGVRLASWPTRCWSCMRYDRKSWF